MKYLLCFFLFCSSLIIQETHAAQKENSYQVTLYYSPQCPYSQKVLSYLKDSGMKIPMKNVRLDRTARQELEQQGGHLIVPCLIVNGNPIYNANDIIDWLKTHQEYLSKSTR